MTVIPDRIGIFGHIPDDAYHQDRASLSSSGARLLLPPSCPAKFKERMDNPPPPTAAFDFGHLAHKLVLGEGADICEIDAADYRTKAAQQARDQAHTEGKIPVLPAELRKAEHLAQAVLTHPEAGLLFTTGRAEMSLYADDPETGVRLRARPDWMITGDNQLVIVDLKTALSAEETEFARKAYGFGYHIQAAFYLRVARLAGLVGAVEPVFLFVAVEKDPPHLVRIFEWDDEALAEGDMLCRQAIDTYARCRTSGEWPGYPGTVAVMKRPRWAPPLPEGTV